MAAFIDEGMNDPHVDTLVLSASIAKCRVTCCDSHWWFVIFMFWYSGFDAPNTSLLAQLELEYYLSEISSFLESRATRHGLAFAIGEPSSEVASWPRFDMALGSPTWSSERKSPTWLQENIVKLKMLNKRRRCFRSSCEKLPLVRMSPSWFWCQHVWFGSRVQNWSCRTTSQEHSVGPGNMSHRWTSSIHDHFDDNFIILKNVQLRLTLRLHIKPQSPCPQDQEQITHPYVIQYPEK